MLPPTPPPLENPPILTGRIVKACGDLWSIELLGMWPSGAGLLPNIDFFCRLTSVGSRHVHSIMLDVPRAFLHRLSPSEAILRALERAMECNPMPPFVALPPDGATSG